jgi:hypothetical protein
MSYEKHFKAEDVKKCTIYLLFNALSSSAFII